MNLASSTIDSIVSERGYISVFEFMNIVVPYYYQHSTAIGANGDFITAPEISQMFGETLATWILHTYETHGLSSASVLELGPGKGTLMSDILRTCKQFPEFSIDDVYLLENSASLRAVQSNTLSKFDCNITWIESIKEIKTDNIFIIANEFFDALPIHQFEYIDNTLYEMILSKDMHNKLSIQKIEVSNEQNAAIDHISDGIYETSPYSADIIEEIASLTAKNIFVLFIDYGYITRPLTSSIQALYRHKHTHFLNHIGNADITSLVDFASLQKTLRNYNFATNIYTQHDFLVNNGISLRAEQLIKSGANNRSILSDLERLTGAPQMGERFKVISGHKSNNQQYEATTDKSLIY